MAAALLFILFLTIAPFFTVCCCGKKKTKKKDSKKPNSKRPGAKLEPEPSQPDEAKPPVDMYDTMAGVESDKLLGPREPSLERCKYDPEYKTLAHVDNNVFESQHASHKIPTDPMYMTLKDLDNNIFDDDNMGNKEDTRPTWTPTSQTKEPNSKNRPAQAPFVPQPTPVTPRPFVPYRPGTPIAQSPQQQRMTYGGPQRPMNPWFRPPAYTFNTNTGPGTGVQSPHYGAGSQPTSPSIPKQSYDTTLISFPQKFEPRNYAYTPPVVRHDPKAPPDVFPLLKITKSFL